ncbi:MAG TPA: hypothetical protein PLE19_23855 [Planctomycetota bacterium]|nr:hypothetical protein [Planctomycetota bacterium]HRR83245.1 hypothetical protein [Planctomycetota bacterium]HRT97451.1 hypothetical protein [Planctomycetota bacterium]
MAAREAASQPGNGPFANLAGGLWNIASAPVQLPITIVETSIERNVLYGLSAGTLQGTAKTLMNLVGGVARVMTAVIPPDPLELVSRKLAYAQAR